MITFFLSFRQLVALSLIAIATILVFLASHETASASVPIPWRDFDLAQGQSNPRGMWGDGNTLWVAENDQGNNEQAIVTYNLSDGERRTQGEFHLDDHGIDIQGIWSDGTVMWVADWGDKKLYAYELNKNSYNNTQRIPDKDISLAGSNDHPRGVWGFGTTVLVVDSDDTKVYAYSTTDGSRLTNHEFNLHRNHDKPYGIWGEGTRVWINDTDDNMVYVYERSTNPANHGNRVEALEISLPRGNDDSWGIWSDGEILWVVDNEDDRVYATYCRGFRHTRDEIDIGDVATPAGLWTDGETMWVADKGRSDHGMLYAYSLSDQTRDSSKDVQLGSFNKKPLSIWSDGETVWTIEDTQSTDYLYPYDMEPSSGQEGQVILSKLIALDSSNSDPRGIWSDEDTIWVSDSGDDKLYAYDLSDKSRKSGKDISLNNNNDDPAEIWSDGEIIWVLDTDEEHVFAYGLSGGSRKKNSEFRLVPDNDDPEGGLTGHALRFWVADGDDEKLYAYGGRNTPPSFGGATASFEFHRSLVAGDYIGTVPQVEDPDEDELDYLLTSGTFGVFRLDRHTGELFVKDGAPAFTGGESYTLTVSVTDGRNRLDALDGDMDDAIDIPVNVITNDNPKFTTADGTIYEVAEDAAQGHTVVELEITDLDDDSLFYEFWTTPGGPFQLVQDGIEVSNTTDLDFESTDSYAGKIRIRDNKNKSGQSDLSWDDELAFTIQVTNVDEAGSLTLSSANPQVDTEIVATLTDPDGVDLDDGNQITWVARRSINSSQSNWTEISSTDTSSTTFSYTPVTLDVGETLQFEATYKDESDGTQSKTIFANTANAVLAAPPTNQPPTFGEDAPEDFYLAENTAIGTNVGEPIPASDPEGDTLTYAVSPTVGDFFDITSTGQVFIKNNEDLDYEGGAVRSLVILLRDSKDPSGEADTDWDARLLVVIRLTNVDEAGTVTLSSDSPEVEVELDARLLDPDRVIHDLEWQWQSADSNPSDTWTDISGATSASYTPTTAVAGKYLRAKASYGDATGSGKEAIGTATNAVIAPDNRAPQFNEGATATRSISEDAVAGARLGAAISALDPENDTLTYSLATGSDYDKFAVDTGTGQLEVAAGAALDYEDDPTLEVVVQVTDSKAADHSQDTAIDDTITVTIELVNVDEPGNVSLSMMEPVVGESITASLSDVDGGVTGASWHWEKSSDGATNWEAINGAESDSYTPVTGDEGTYLRAMVTYTDDEGADKSAAGMTSGIVQPPSNDDDDSGEDPPTEDDDDSGEDPPTEDNDNNGGQGQNSGEDSPTEDNDNNGGSQNTQPQSFTDICRQDLRDGLIADCVVNDFATARVGHDGSYTVDWSEWGEDHPDVTGYTLILQQLLYKTVYENGVEIDTWTLSDVYETCEFTDGAWNCERPIRSNYFEDWAGNATGVRTVVDNSDQTQWSYSLDSPGRHTATMTFQRWSGDASDPSNEPVPVTYTAMKFEIDVVRLLTHGGSGETGVIGINGANGFD